MEQGDYVRPAATGVAKQRNVGRAPGEGKWRLAEDYGTFSKRLRKKTALNHSNAPGYLVPQPCWKASRKREVPEPQFVNDSIDVIRRLGKRKCALFDVGWIAEMDARVHDDRFRINEAGRTADGALGEGAVSLFGRQRQGHRGGTPGSALSLSSAIRERNGTALPGGRTAS